MTDREGWELAEEYLFSDEAKSGRSKAARDGLEELLRLAALRPCSFGRLIIVDSRPPTIVLFHAPRRSALPPESSPSATGVAKSLPHSSSPLSNATPHSLPAPYASSALQQTERSNDRLYFSKSTGPICCIDLPSRCSIESQVRSAIWMMQSQ